MRASAKLLVTPAKHVLSACLQAVEGAGAQTGTELEIGNRPRPA
jgi:hypothetical protein